MTSKNTYREKGRAVFLAAIMVLSVVAVSATFAGTAAAATSDRTPEGTVTVSPGETVPVEVSVTAEGGETLDLLTEDYDTRLAVSNADSEEAGAVDNGDSIEVVYLASGVTSDTLTYDATVPSDAADGASYQVSGTVVTSESEDSTGSTTLVVDASDDDDDDDDPDPPTNPGQSDDGSSGSVDETSTTDVTINQAGKTVLTDDVNFASEFTTFDDDSTNYIAELLAVPTQTDFYSDELEQVGVNQQVSTTFDVNATAGTQEIVIDFSDAADFGLAVNASNSDFDEFGSDNIEIEDVSIDNAAGEIVVELDVDEDRVGATLAGVVQLEADNPVDGVSVDAAETLRHTAYGADGTTESDNYRVIETATVGISHSDTDNAGFLETTTDPVPRLDGGTQGAYTVRVGQTVSFETASAGNTISIYEAEQNDDDEWILGDQVDEVGTSPSDVTSYDTSDLSPRQDYFVTFNDEDTEAVFVRAKPLNLETSVSDEISVENNIEVDVESDDIEGGSVEAWFIEDTAGEEGISDILHVEEEQLDGDGEATFVADPVDDLDEESEYYALVQHEDSGIITQTDTFSVVEPPEETVTITNPDPSGDTFARGDIVRVDLEFENTDTGTITFGERDDQNIEINATVRDINGNGEATFYINTFQVGDGQLSNDTEFEGADVDAEDWGDKNHGFFINPADEGSAAFLGEEGQTALAYPDIEVGGGSNTGGIAPQVVLSNISYDIVASPGEDAYTAESSLATDRTVANIQQRSTDDLQAWSAPGTGADVLEPETVDEIAAAAEDGRVTPQDGVSADQDLVIMQINSTGLEGVLHNEIVTNDSDEMIDVDEFLNREENHFVTEPFFGTGITQLDTVQAESDLPDDQPNLRSQSGAYLPLQQEEVLAGTDDSGNLNRYYLAVQADFGETEDPNDTAEELPVSWNSSFQLNPPTGVDADEFPRNDFLNVDGDGTQYHDWEHVLDDVTIDTEGDRLRVPAVEDATVTGQTDIAAGTNVSFRVQTTTGQDRTFFKTPSARVDYVENAPNTIEFQEDFTGFEGYNFSINANRARAVGELIVGDDGERNTDDDGQLGTIVTGEERVVDSLVFEDQESIGDSVVVSEFDATQGGFVGIHDSEGNRLGESDVSASAQSDLEITLDEPIEETQELTAVAYRTEGEQYQEGTTSDTATVTVVEAAPEFTVSNLDPASATVEPGDDVTVSADITNTGTAEGTQDIVLSLDGEEVDSESLTLDAGASDSVSFDISAPMDDGDYEHAISSDDDEAAGSLTVSTMTESPSPTAEPTETESDDSGPGFGVVAALIAFIGAALLATRRQN